MGKLALDIHARNPRVLLEALGDLIGIHVKERRILGKIDELHGVVLGHMLAAMNLNIGGGKQTRVDDDDGNNGKYGHGCQDAARDLALTLNGRSGVGRLACHGTQR